MDKPPSKFAIMRANRARQLRRTVGNMASKAPLSLVDALRRDIEFVKNLERGAGLS